MKNPLLGVYSGDEVLLSIDQVAFAGSSAMRGAFRGEFVLKSSGESDSLRVVRGGLYHLGEVNWRGRVGAVVLRPRRGEGRIRHDKSCEKIELDLRLEIDSYFARQDRLVSTTEVGHIHGQLLGTFSLDTGQEGWRMSGARLVLRQAGSLDSIESTTVLGRAGVFPLPNKCPNGIAACGRQTLYLQPVCFFASPEDSKPTGQFMTEQLKAAYGVWNRCCFSIVSLPAKNFIVSEKLKNSDKIDEIAGSIPLANRDGGVVYVFSVDNDLKASGGGDTPYVSSIVMPNLNTPNLLAHEIGHVLGGTHPDGTGGGSWRGGHDTVLDPDTGFPSRLEADDCRSAQDNNPFPNTPAPAANCCMKPDEFELHSFLSHRLRHLWSGLTGRID